MAVLARADAAGDPARREAAAIVVETTAARVLESRELREEVFGPSSLLVSASSTAELRRLAGCFAGQLTATVHGTPADLAAAGDLLAMLARTAGRVIVNGFPTGVEVCHAMQHGGPWPAASDARFTSVGSAALERFVRPVCYQNVPDALLPPALQDANPLGIERLVDGVRSRAAVSFGHGGPRCAAAGAVVAWAVVAWAALAAVHLPGNAACAADEFVVHVSADAAASGDGSERSPYRTLTEARDGIRRVRAAGALGPGEPVTVLIDPGTYRLDASFELSAEDGGTPEAPVVYRGRNRGQARIQGGVTLAAGAFQPLTDERVLARLDPAVRGRVLVCDVSAVAGGGFAPLATAYRGTPEGPWLYADGRPMTLARWPNVDAAEGGWAGFSKVVETGLPREDADDPAVRGPHPGAFEFDDPRPARWNVDEGVWLRGYWTHDWADEVIRIAAYDKERKILALAAPHHYGINGGATWGAASRRFHALNLLEELDEPGEWYLDRTRALLYVYPAGAVQDSHYVLATLTEPLVALVARAT